MQNNRLNAVEQMNLKDRIDSTSKGEDKLIVNVYKGPFFADIKREDNEEVYYLRYQSVYIECCGRELKGINPYLRCIDRLKRIREEYGDLKLESEPPDNKCKKLISEELKKILSDVYKN